MSLFGEEYLSETDKIDQVYRMLRSQQRSRRIGLAIKLIIIGGLVYGYHYITMPEHADIQKKLISGAEARMTDLIVPMVGNIVGNMASSMTSNLQIPQINTPGGSVEHKNIPSGSSAPTTSAPQVNITPEMIQAVQKAMKK